MEYSTRVYQELCSKIRNVNKDTFDEVALAVFHYQAQNNGLYQQFIKLLGISPDRITKVIEIPFLPISFFKHHLIKTQDWETETIFRSSGTTLKSPAEHHIRSLPWYRDLSRATFEAKYGVLEDYVILGLLPSYLEQGASSLVYMVEQFIQFSQEEDSGLFLHDFATLAQLLQDCASQQKKVLLIGVTYALLDFAAAYPMALQHTIVMETGGMKGRRKEMTKPEVHQILKEAFQLQEIHSEYGMTELLSQGYSSGQGRFDPAPTMQVLIREATDPFHYMPFGKSGGINMIDLANIDSCAFIATDDLGKVYPNGQFEVLGRLSAADLRGCNLMIGE